MNCRELAELLMDYLAGELPPEQADGIRQHLADCRTCTCYIETYRLTITLTRQLPAVAPPPSLLERVRAALKEK